MADDGGISWLQARLNAIPKAVRDAVIPTLEREGDALASKMQTLAPVDTGRLKNSIAVTLPGQSTPPYSQPGGSRTANELEVLVTAGNSKVRYPHLVEYGTTHAHAQPYFWPAFRLSRKGITSRIKRAITVSVRKNWGK